MNWRGAKVKIKWVLPEMTNNQVSNQGGGDENQASDLEEVHEDGSAMQEQLR